MNLVNNGLTMVFVKLKNLSFNGFLKFKFSNGQNIFENFPPKVVLKIINYSIINNVRNGFLYIKRIFHLTVFWN